MVLSADVVAMLEAVSEPAILLDQDRTVVAASRRSRVLLGPSATGLPLRGFHAGDGDALDLYLDRCMASTDGLVGALLLRRGDAVTKHRCRGARAAFGHGAGVLLRIERGEEARFVALSRKVAELNVEVRERRHAEAVLAEALCDRDLLLRELHHRVKNNVHMLSALLQGAERETASLDAKAVLRDASLRVSAVSAVQQLIYGAHDRESIAVQEMIVTVARGAVTLAPKMIDLTVSVEPCAIRIDAAVAVALIVNELVTNAVKHGRPGESRPSIHVAWRMEEGRVRLTVEDNGPGFVVPESAKRASGLGLVRGLLRQLGGSLAVETGTVGEARGVCCTACFPIPSERQGRRKA